MARLRSLRRWGLSGLSVVALFSAGGPARAHHSFAAEFDAQAKGKLAGTVTRVFFSNPHVRYRIEVAGEDGAGEEWELQLGSVTALRGVGFGPETLAVGDRVVAEGELGRNGTKKMYVRSLETADGRVLYSPRRSGPEQLLTGRDPAEFGYGKRNADAPFDISGAWSNRYKFRLTVDDLEPKPTPFTPEGRRIFEATDHFDDYALRCIALGLPRIFGAPYNMEIFDAGRLYLTVYVEQNTPRRIFMDGRKPPENLPPSSLGFSVGHWEGNTLVIETTHLAPGWLDGSGLPMSGDGTRIVERWKLAEDGLSMDRTMTIYDPYYTEPLVRQRGSARGDDVEIAEQGSCDPDGYYRDLLEAGRLEEHLNR
jgi:hypothetical protein